MGTTKKRGQWVDLPFKRGEAVECREPGRRPWTGTVHAIEANNYHSDKLSVVYVVIPHGGSLKRPDYHRRRRYIDPALLRAALPSTEGAETRG